MDNDPITGKPYGKDAIQRVLHISPKVLLPFSSPFCTPPRTRMGLLLTNRPPKVHVYRIPPIASTKGFSAARWTSNPSDQIFTARLRVLETAVPSPNSAADAPTLTVTLLLEDPRSAELFAAAPYDRAAAVEQANDSSRFFAVRVVGAGGMRATLGIGFEERAEAFEFSVALQDVRRTMGFDGAAGAAKVGGGGRGQVVPKTQNEEVKRDFSLREGEMITIDIGGRGMRVSGGVDEEESGAAPFAIPPPPQSSRRASASMHATSAAVPVLAPPPSSASVRAGLNAQDPGGTEQRSAEELGFDDGEFGEFQ